MTAAHAAWRVEVGTVVVPCPGETRAADRAWVRTFPGATIIVVLDVAGHGSRAASAAEAVANAAATWTDAAPDAWLFQLDRALRGSQGAVAAVARFDTRAGALDVASVGNVCCIWFGNRARSFENCDGLLGVVMPTVRAAQVPFEAGARLVMLSDGVRSAAQRELAGSVFQASPGVLAHDIVARHQRRHDDATCVVASVNRLLPPAVIPC